MMCVNGVKVFKNIYGFNFNPIIYLSFKKNMTNC